jgi:quinol-cytochrome oxidoreductase complex cytochrome b subunit
MSFGDWLNDRTGYRAGLRRVLDEPVPGDVNWFFTLGSVLLFLLALQFVTGVTLTMYYVPTPAYAYESLRISRTSCAAAPISARSRCRAGTRRT